MLNISRSIKYSQFRLDTGWRQEEAQMAVESPVGLTVNGKEWVTLMCTPCDLDALCIGFLFNESVIHSYDEVASLHICADLRNVDIWLEHNVDLPNTWRRTSGCSGGVTTYLGTPKNTVVKTEFTMHAEQVIKLMDKMLKSQTLYRSFGGIHSAAISDGNEIIFQMEDIGRHNTLDKLCGRCLLESHPTDNHVILTTGRVSSEMLQKAAHMAVPVVVSRTSPTSMAVDTANQAGITLIGYARQARYNVYTHEGRIFPEDNVTEGR